MTATVVLVLVVSATWTMALFQDDALNHTCQFPLEQSTNLTWVNGSWYNIAVGENVVFYNTDYDCNKLDIIIENQTSMVFQYDFESNIKINEIVNVNISNQSYWTRENSLIRMTDLLKDGSVLAITECSFQKLIRVYARNYTMNNEIMNEKLRKHFNTLWLLNCYSSNLCHRPVNGAPTINTFVPFGLLVTTVLLRVL